MATNSAKQDCFSLHCIIHARDTIRHLGGIKGKFFLTSSDRLYFAHVSAIDAGRAVTFARMRHTELRPNSLE